ncbi:Odorant receptor 94b [Culex quinquefasciatus]|uniref:Odorant receptor n=1 Tax=Culex quinquefasciatus TaxID=7176 RepID=B0W597_CULQU|nr:Odorant receptor 94b [Culex quinquefasciatus]|eukprot:XP_001843881.1 Odorant receptor 94b [Culex quinquefasciatus]
MNEKSKSLESGFDPPSFGLMQSIRRSLSLKYRTNNPIHFPMTLPLVVAGASIDQHDWSLMWFLSGLSTNVMELLRRRIRQWRNGLESEFSNPKLLFEKTCDSVSKWSTICGWERFEPNYTRANPRFIFLMGLVKAYMFTHDTIYALLQYNMKRFENPNKIPEIHNSLMKTASWCTISVKLIAPSYATMAALTVIISLLISAFERRFELPFGFFIPGVNRATWIGYLLNLAFHTLQAFVAGGGLLATDMCFFNLIINAIGQLDVLIIRLRKLGEAATSGKHVEAELYQFLREIIQEHMEHVKYLDGVASKSDYLKNKIVYECPHLPLQNDELIREIYITSWNELPISAQQALKLLLQASQKRSPYQTDSPRLIWIAF